MAVPSPSKEPPRCQLRNAPRPASSTRRGRLPERTRFPAPPSRARMNRPGFRAYFLSWEGCHVHASQVRSGHEGEGGPAGPRVYRPGSEPYVTSAEPPPGSVPDWLTPRARDVRHVRLRPENADL